MLSLVAMAALPMAGLADALVPEVGEGKWQTETGDEVDLDDQGLLVSIGGSTITKKITLVPGTYSVNAGTSNNAVIKIKVKANEKTYKKGIKFTLEEEGEITVTLSAESKGNDFSVGDLALTLHYDFNAAQTYLRDMLNGAWNKLERGDDADFWEQDLNKEYSKQDGLLQLVFSIEDNGADAYKVYKGQELYRGVQNSKAYETIKAYVDEVDACEANKQAFDDYKTLAKGWQANELDALQTTLNSAKDPKTKNFYKEGVESLNTEVTNFLTELEAKYKGKEAVAYTEGKAEWAEGMPTNISELQAKILAFDEVMQAVTKATDESEGYNTKVAELIKDINATGRYKEILADVKETLAEDYKPVYEVEQFIKNKDNDPRTDKDANIQKVQQAQAKMQADYALYAARLQAYTAAYAEWDAFQGRLNTVQNGLEAIENTDYNGRITEIQGKLNDIDSMFQQGMKDDKDLPDWSEKKSNVETLLVSLETETQATLANYNAWQGLLGQIEGLRNSLTAADENVAGYISNDEAYAATDYWTVSEGIGSDITALEEDAKAAYNNGTAVDFKENKAEQKRFNDIQKAIDNYDKKAKTARNNYNTVQNELKNWQSALEKVRGIVDNPDVTMSDGTTYRKALAEAEQTIANLQTGLEAALDLKNYDHADAMNSLAKTKKPNVLNTTKDSYEQDLQNYSENRALEAAVKLVGDVNALKAQVLEQRDSLQNVFGSIPTTEVEDYGLRYSIIAQQLQDYENTLTGMLIVDATSITKDNAIDELKKLNEQLQKLYEIQNWIGSVNLEKIKEEVQANKSAYDTLNGNFATLKGEIEKINDFTATSGQFAEKSYNKDPNRSDEFETEESKLLDKWTTLTAGLNEALQNETVVTGDWQKKYDEFAAEVTKAVDAAKASTDNWNAYNELLTKVEDTFYPWNEDGTERGDLIDMEKEEVKAIATPENAGQQHFLGELDRYRTQLGTLEGTDTQKGKIEQAYDKRTCKTGKTDLVSEIESLADRITGTSDMAQTNEDNHNSLLEKETETLKLWNTVYDKLSGEDQSSKIMEWLDQLRDIKTEFDGTVGDVEDNFGKGYYSDAEKYNTDVSTFEDYRTQINTIKANWEDPSGYLAAIVADNADRHQAFQEALSDARDAFNKAVISLAKFQNISDEELQVEFDEVIKANQTQRLYDYSELFRDLQAAEQTAYDGILAITSPAEGTGTPAAFDLEEEFRKTAEEYTADINNIYNDTTDELNATSQQLLSEALDAAEQAVSAAETAIAGYHNEVKANAFAEEKHDIQTGRNWLEDNYRELAVELANGFLAEVRGIGASVLVECEELAQKEYGVVEGELMVYDENARQKLETCEVPEGDDTDYLQRYIDAYNQYISGEGGFIEIGNEAMVQNKMFSDEGLKAAMDQYELFMQHNGFKKFLDQVSNKIDSEAAYGELQGVINGIQDIIDDAREYADAYIITNPDVETYQNTLNSIIAAIDARRVDGTVHSNRTVFEAELNICKNSAEQLNGKSNYLENEELNSQIEHLRYEYNQAVAAGVVDAQNQQKYEADINGYQDELDNIYSNYLINYWSYRRGEATHAAFIAVEEATNAAFIALEGKIAASRNDITNLFNPSLIATLRDNLTSLAEDVQALCEANKKNLDENCHEPVQNSFAAELEAAAEKAAVAAGKIQTYWEAETLLFYSERLNNTLEQLKNSLTTMAEEIEKAEAPYDVNDAACKRLQTELDGYVARYNALKEKLQNYKHCNYDGFLSDTRFTDKSKQDQERLDKAQKEFATDRNVMLSEDATLLYEYYEALLLNLDRTYSYYEAEWRVQDVYDKLAEAKKELEGYSYIRYKDVDDLYHEIYSGYRHMLKFNEGSWGTTNGGGSISKDVYGNELLNEFGVPVPYKYISWEAYVSECVPAVFECYEKLLEKVEEYRQLILDCRYLLGDVNEDTEVLVDDYTTILRHTLGAELITADRLLAAADANVDGAVNIGDLTAVARIITGTDAAEVHPAAAPSRVRSIIVPSSDAVTVRFEGEGVHQRIAVSVNASRLYAGAQMDIRLPEGITLSATTTGAGAEGFAIHTHELENGLHRVVLSSLEGLTFAENGDALLWLDVQVGHNFNGEGVEISNILFSDTTARVFSLQAPTGNATGLGTVTITDEVKDKIYSVGGILMDGLKRGVNIIRGNDGSGKKIIVK